MLAFVMEFIGETVSSIPFVFLDPGWSKGFSLIRTIRVKDKAVSVKLILRSTPNAAMNIFKPPQAPPPAAENSSPSWEEWQVLTIIENNIPLSQSDSTPSQMHYHQWCSVKGTVRLSLIKISRIIHRLDFDMRDSILHCKSLLLQRLLRRSTRQPTFPPTGVTSFHSESRRRLCTPHTRQSTETQKSRSVEQLSSRESSR